MYSSDRFLTSKRPTIFIHPCSSYKEDMQSVSCPLLRPRLGVKGPQLVLAHAPAADRDRLRLDTEDYKRDRLIGLDLSIMFEQALLGLVMINCEKS
jgi:hypothetical protein